ncbi:HK97 gp10 family phage protein [Planctomicrobium sp. SH527]|uniref:HK97 gp10 family phage protein n=1 Tax=Planctomicrobium sp. SH527 TaxID=3448123 RepID=UPI003F5C0BEB
MSGMMGMDEFEQAMTELATEFPKQVGPSAVGAGLDVFVKKMRQAAPQGKTGRLRRSPGKTVTRRSGGSAGKAGFDVGQKSETKDVRGPHAHLYYLGTEERFRTGSKGNAAKGIGGRYRSVEMRIRRGIYTPEVAKFKRRTGRGSPHTGMQGVLSGAVNQAFEAMAERATKKLTQLMFKF